MAPQCARKAVCAQSSVRAKQCARKAALSPPAPRTKNFVALTDTGQIQALVARNVNINEGDYDGRTALHVAACEGHLHIVEYLLRLGANVRARDRFGNSPLDDARRETHPAVAELLERHAQNGKTTAAAQSLVAPFRSIPVLGQNPGTAVTPKQISLILRSVGLLVESDPRFSAAYKQLPGAVTEGDFVRFLAAHPVLPRAFEGRLAVPDFSDLRNNLTTIFNASAALQTGAVPTFPPNVATANTSSYALAACTIDGQSCADGNAADTTCIYSLAKVCEHEHELEHELERGLERELERRRVGGWIGGRRNGRGRAGLGRGWRAWGRGGVEGVGKGQR